jgi:hypothetical protein
MVTVNGTVSISEVFDEICRVLDDFEPGGS